MREVHVWQHLGKACDLIKAFENALVLLDKDQGEQEKWQMADLWRYPQRCILSSCNMGQYYKSWTIEAMSCHYFLQGPRFKAITYIVPVSVQKIPKPAAIFYLYKSQVKSKMSTVSKQVLSCPHWPALTVQRWLFCIVDDKWYSTLQSLSAQTKCC